jgi:hypothetical protein
VPASATSARPSVTDLIVTTLLAFHDYTAFEKEKVKMYGLGNDEVHLDVSPAFKHME